MIAKIDSLSGVADDVLCSGVGRVSSSDELLHLVDVERSHDLREGQVLSDGTRDSDLQTKATIKTFIFLTRFN